MTNHIIRDKMYLHDVVIHRYNKFLHFKKLINCEKRRQDLHIDLEFSEIVRKYDQLHTMDILWTLAISEICGEWQD